MVYYGHMTFLRTLFGLLALAAIPLASARGADALPLDSAAKLANALSHADADGNAFALSATVFYISTNAFNGGMNIAAEDETGAMIFRVDSGTTLRHTPACGDRVHLMGTVRAFMQDRRFAVLDDCRFLGKTTPPVPVRRTLAQLTDGTSSYRLSEVDAVLTDIAYSSINQEWLLLLLRDKANSLFVSAPCDSRRCYERLSELVGSRIRATGICIPYDHGIRKLIEPLFKVASADDIQPADMATAADMSDYPSISRLNDLRLGDFAFEGKHRAEGHVVAVRSDRSIVLRTPDGNFVGVDFANTVLPPTYGTYVEVAGLPDTDLFRINLFRATWRAKDGQTLPAEPPFDLRSSDLLGVGEDKGQKSVHCHRCYARHGHPITLVGIVRSISRPEAAGSLFVESDGHLITVDAGSQTNLLDGLSVGSEVRVTGTCVLNVGARRTNSMLAEITGFTLVLRTANDLTVLAEPSWWTARRLLILLAFGLAALLGTIFWNLSLNRRAKAKGRELAAEQLAHVTSELKVNERTRLAVELHDALSQTLTGVSMQIDTAAGFAKGKVPAISKCLSLASRTIDACRTELRNTLWDLRSAALDEPSMDAAIRKTLCQNLTGIDLTVRFNVAREAFSDNTAHAVLKIIRELATNSIRHGKASSVKIAGTIEDGNLLFSVRDNGCGFDPDLAPGISEGHFGLQGISERLERINGEMKIESAIGKGARVTVILPIPRSGE